MKLFLVDLDDTLVDTRSFKTNLFQSIARIHNVSKDQIESIYEELKKENSMEQWKKRFEHLLGEKLNIPVSLDAPITEAIRTLTVIPKTLHFVEKFVGDKVILSYGDPEIQKEKIKMLHLSDKFNDILITTGRKDLFLDTIISAERVILNNKEYSNVTIIDNDETLLSIIKSRYPWIKSINPVDLV